MGKLTHNTQIKHSTHPHLLQLSSSNIHLQNSNNLCAICNLQVSPFEDHIYTCTPCNFFLHTSCSKFHDLINHPSHPNHTLSLLSTPHGFSRCVACNQQGLNRFRYCCQVCGYDLHALCASKPLSVTHPTHPHPLLLTFSSAYGENNGFSCDLCRGVGSGDEWLYRCVSCEFDVHLDCATATTPPSPPPPSPPPPPLQDHHSFSNQIRPPPPPLQHHHSFQNQYTAPPLAAQLLTRSVSAGHAQRYWQPPQNHEPIGVQNYSPPPQNPAPIGVQNYPPPPQNPAPIGVQNYPPPPQNPAPIGAQNYPPPPQNPAPIGAQNYLPPPQNSAPIGAQNYPPPPPPQHPAPIGAQNYPPPPPPQNPAPIGVQNYPPPPPPQNPTPIGVQNYPPPPPPSAQNPAPVGVHNHRPPPPPPQNPAPIGVQNHRPPPPPQNSAPIGVQNYRPSPPPPPSRPPPALVGAQSYWPPLPPPPPPAPPIGGQSYRLLPQPALPTLNINGVVSGLGKTMVTRVIEGTIEQLGHNFIQNLDVGGGIDILGDGGGDMLLDVIGQIADSTC